MPKFKVREEGEFEWSEFEASDAASAAVAYAQHDYSECDGWERQGDRYRVTVQGERAGDCVELEVLREFEPVFSAYRTGELVNG